MQTQHRLRVSRLFVLQVKRLRSFFLRATLKEKREECLYVGNITHRLLSLARRDGRDAADDLKMERGAGRTVSQSEELCSEIKRKGQSHPIFVERDRAEPDRPKFLSLSWIRGRS